MRTGALFAVAVGLLWPCVAGAQAVCTDDIAHAAVREQASFASGQSTVRGLIYRPVRPNGAGVVLLHGARGLGSDAPVFDPHAIQLASRGYHVLVPNYYDVVAGRAERTGRDIRVWRRAAADAAGFLASQPGMERDRVGLWGFSLGGYLSGETAMESELVRAAVAVAGGLDVWEAGRDRRAVPLLLIHARRDPVISPISTRRWAEDLQRRGAVTEVQALAWDGHALDRPTWCDVFTRTRTFLDRELAGGGA